MRIAPPSSNAGGNQPPLFDRDPYGPPGSPWNDAEQALCRVLAEIQAHLPRWESLTFGCNLPLRVPGYTRKPDVFVAYFGRAGLIEVDREQGHSGQRHADRSRDHLFEDAGFAYVDRISAEDACNRREAELFLRRFLRILKSR